MHAGNVQQERGQLLCRGCAQVDRQRHPAHRQVSVQPRGADNTQVVIDQNVCGMWQHKMTPFLSHNSKSLSLQLNLQQQKLFCMLSVLFPLIVV